VQRELGVCPYRAAERQASTAKLPAEVLLPSTSSSARLIAAAFDDPAQCIVIHLDRLDPSYARSDFSANSPASCPAPGDGFAIYDRSGRSWHIVYEASAPTCPVSVLPSQVQESLDVCPAGSATGPSPKPTPHTVTEPSQTSGSPALPPTTTIIESPKAPPLSAPEPPGGGQSVGPVPYGYEAVAAGAWDMVGTTIPAYGADTLASSIVSSIVGFCTATCDVLMNGSPLSGSTTSPTYPLWVSCDEKSASFAECVLSAKPNPQTVLGSPIEFRVSGRKIVGVYAGAGDLTATGWLNFNG